MKEQYVTLNLENIVKTPVIQKQLGIRRRILWRSWRQLSRFQKNLVVLGVCLTILFLTWLTEVWEYPSSRTQFNRTQELHEEHILPLPPSFASPMKLSASASAPSAKNDAQILEPIVELVKLKPEKKRKKFPQPSGVKQNAVIRAVKHAWRGYKKFAWGHDHLRPITGSSQDWFLLGLTIVDSLDTLLIMNLDQEYNEAREWVSTSLNYDGYRDVNLFETTIRVVGGLLAAYHITDDDMYVEKATLLADKLMPCFADSTSVIPYSDINMVTRRAHAPHWNPDSSLAEVGTLQLEFRDLSRVSGDNKYEKATADISEHIHRLIKPDGLAPIFISPHTGQFNRLSEIKIGARGDSYYEYLLKQWIQTGKTADYLKDDYIEAVDGIWKRLVKVTPKRNLTFVGELKATTHQFHSCMDHLTCFLPGTLALGVHHGMPKKHLDLAIALTETCYFMYADQPTFLSPEVAYFNYDGTTQKPDMYILPNDAHYLLRPEFVESLWYMYLITGNKTYQTWGWKVFQAIERYTKVENGYTTIGNVLDPANVAPKNLMESFLLSETFKYLYLLFSPTADIIDIDKYVMNTEGHPLPVYDNYNIY